jgi:hypothetical protein
VLRSGEVLQEPMLSNPSGHRPAGFQILFFTVASSVARELNLAEGDRVDLGLEFRSSDGFGSLALKHVLSP